MVEKMRYILKLLIVILLNICAIGIIGHTRNAYREESEQVLSPVDPLYSKAVRGPDAGPKSVRNTGTPAKDDADTHFPGEHGSTAESDYLLLAMAISAESQNEPYTGQVAVAAVILNRVEHPAFPDSLAGVVYQPGAFASVTNGKLGKNVGQSAYRAAKDALNGLDPSGGAIYYYDSATPANEWLLDRPVIKIIGRHTFCG